jgi:ABC-2 type transport system permease protein
MTRWTVDLVKKLLAVMQKDFRLLLRDRAGLLVLFAMPAVLVLVITLVQENILKTVGESETRILFVDHDRQAVAKALAQKLQETGSIRLIRTLDGKAIPKSRAVAAIAAGEYQICIVVPRGITTAMRTNARRAVKASLSPGKSALKTKLDAPAVDVYFDPTVLGGFRSALRSSLQLILYGIEVGEKAAALTELLPAFIEKSLQESTGPFLPEGLSVEPPAIDLDWQSSPAVDIKEQVASRKGLGRLPTSVQQNVPAWSLFGIFFVVLPIAGSMIKERLDGTHRRLMSMPVAYLTLTLGKVCAYIVVCAAQIGLIFCIGKWLLPLLGTPPLQLGHQLPALMLVCLSSVLAATGYGVLLGTVVRTYEQASMFGPISVVVAAAVGGIMVPVYAMPKAMQTLSVLSPLGWGLNAFMELLVRGGSLKSVLVEVSGLVGFFMINMAVAWAVFSHRMRAGR